VRLSPVATNAPPQASRRRSRAGGSGGVPRRRGLPQRLVPRHIVQAVAAAALRCVGAARRPLPPSPLLRRFRRASSCRTRPQTLPLRSVVPPPLRSRAGSNAAAWLWRVAPLVRLRRFVLGGPHPRLRFPGFFGGCRRFGSARAIDAPDKKSAAAGGRKETSASGQPECSGVLRSFLTPQPASPGLAPLAPPHTGSPPAFASE